MIVCELVVKYNVYLFCLFLLTAHFTHLCSLFQYSFEFSIWFVSIQYIIQGSNLLLNTFYFSRVLCVIFSVRSVPFRCYLRTKFAFSIRHIKPPIKKCNTKNGKHLNYFQFAVLCLVLPRIQNCLVQLRCCVLLLYSWITCSHLVMPIR